MKRISLLSALIIALAFVQGKAQTPLPSPRPTSPKPDQKTDDDNIVRITTNLIQVDAVVNDKSGKPVGDLGPEDFEILVNGKPQKITTFSYVGPEPALSQPPVVTAKNADKKVPPVAPVPPVRLRPDQVKRTIALIVDDLNMSVRSVPYVRSALKNFVDQQMEPGDLVAIVRVGSGIGALQQFTADKRQLYSAIEQIKYNLNANRVLSVIGTDPIETAVSLRGGLTETGPGIQKSGDVEALRDDLLVSASLAATDYVVKGMRSLPGRKAVLLVSDGFVIQARNDPEFSFRIREAIKRLVDDSARSAVVISTMDSRGLVAEGLAPHDAISSTSQTSQDISRGYFEVINNFHASQEGLRYLAEQTGGLAIQDSNDLKGGIRKALDDLKSYYVIGFQPDASVLDQAGRRFNQLTVRVKGSGLHIRYRSGFFGIKDQPAPDVANNPQQQIIRALTSPFGSTDISLRLTPLFTHDPKAGSIVRSFVHISTADLTFENEPQGVHRAVINIVAYTFDDNGGVVDSVGETHTISLSDELYRRALKSGLVYSVNVPIKKPGGYQLRVAVRDVKSAKLGSASHFITIPDLKKNHLALSGIALSSYDPRAEQKRTSDPGGDLTSDSSGNNLLTQAALRRFRSGHVMQFAYNIYNAVIDKSTGQPRLITVIKLFRDGREVYVGKDMPFDPKGQLDPAHLVAQGSLQLGGLDEGEYVLQVIAVDTLGKVKYRTAETWIDFEVVK